MWENQNPALKVGLAKKRRGLTHPESVLSAGNIPTRIHGLRACMCQTQGFLFCGIISFNPHDSPLRSLPPFSWLRKLRFREIKQIDQSHKDHKWQSWDRTNAIPFQGQTLNYCSPHLDRSSLSTPLWASQNPQSFSCSSTWLPVLEL